MKREYWLIAYEPSGRMGYLRASFAYLFEARKKLEELRKMQPEFRYEIRQIV